MRIKQCLVIIAVSFCLMGSLKAATGWLTDFQEAKELSAKKDLPILVDFSGSDWCGWCIKLDKEVFSKEFFKDYAKSNLILFSADFPMNKEQSTQIKTQNNELAEKYNVKGYPTVLLLSADGNVLLRTGYKSGGPEAYVKSLESTVAKYKNKQK
jgi:protein disulfide-isomerase